MEVVKGGKEESTKQEYDRSKRYTWTPEDKFELTGDQFGMIINAFRAILGSEMARLIPFIEKANEGIEQAMQDAVEKGIVKESQPLKKE